MSNVENQDWATFMDRLVHDLREPLRSINVFSELMTENATRIPGQDSEQFLKEIRVGASRMHELLEGLAGYAGALHETSDSSSGMPASLQSAFKIIVANMDEQLREAGASIIGTGLPKLDISLDRAIQLLGHLIANALKFRSEAAPVIRVSANEQDDGLWAISVEDNGIGIAPENREAVFQPFMKVEGKKYPGAGLGLAICKRIVEAHGGMIWIDASPGRGPSQGQGTICAFTLPEG